MYRRMRQRNCPRAEVHRGRHLLKTDVGDIGIYLLAEKEKKSRHRASRRRIARLVSRVLSVAGENIALAAAIGGIENLGGNASSAHHHRGILRRDLTAIGRSDNREMARVPYRRADW